MIWNPDKCISLLPLEISGFFQLQAAYLFKDLSLNKLCIEIVPAPEPRFEGHKVRVVVKSNPSWYSELYWCNDWFRRDLSLRSLERISEFKDRDFDGLHFKYDSIYRELILGQLANGFMDSGFYVEPVPEVVEFFKISSPAVPSLFL